VLISSGYWPLMRLEEDQSIGVMKVSTDAWGLIYAVLTYAEQI